MAGGFVNLKLSSSVLNYRYRPKTCVLCGNEFVPLTGHAKYCFGCRREAEKIMRIRRKERAGRAG